ncbi:putative F-box/LRR-repeat protein 23 [Heracleum sosnowskyi]|uniref:F-box/LRR-repeat protein 23 n=1 Tax=Heracleum sosnowskyi TaxID=360622 RepID=A0AAD8HZC8_9APIA|nr:putative F-box/LRR-repeat protein 23 [Heracleum sosnowskyi]
MPRRRKTSKPKTIKKWVKKTNWLDLPADITSNILHRLGAVEILESAQKVCTAWRRICKDPAMWRVIDMKNHGDLGDMPYDLEIMCRHAIDRSQGQLVEINIEYFGTDELMEYLAQGGRSSQLKRLQISCCYGMIYESWSEFLKKIPLLEEIELTFAGISEETVANAGRYCPMLKIFKYNDRGYMHDGRPFSQEIADGADAFVMAIAKGMPQLLHLELIGSAMTNKGLQAILDGCPQLESLDLRRCFYLNLDGSFGKLCKERIKNLKLPCDSVKDHKFALDNSEYYHAMSGDHGAPYDYYDDSDPEDYEGLSDYDIYCGPYYNHFRDMSDDSDPGELSSLQEVLAVMHAMHIGNSSDSD